MLILTTIRVMKLCLMFVKLAEDFRGDISEWLLTACLKRLFDMSICEFCWTGRKYDFIFEWCFWNCNRTIVLVYLAFWGVWGGIRGKGLHFVSLCYFFQDKAKGHFLAVSPLFSCCPFLCGSRTVSQSFCTSCPTYCRSRSRLPSSEVPISRRDLSPLA